MAGRFPYLAYLGERAGLPVRTCGCEDDASGRIARGEAPWEARPPSPADAAMLARGLAALGLAPAAADAYLEAAAAPAARSDANL